MFICVVRPHCYKNTKTNSTPIDYKAVGPNLPFIVLYFMNIDDFHFKINQQFW